MLISIKGGRGIMAEIKIHNYGGWVALCFVVQIFWPGIIQCESLLIHFIPITVAVVLSVLGIRQHYKIKNVMKVAFVDR